MFDAIGFGKRLKMYRVKNHISQKELSLRTGKKVSQSHISDLENGEGVSISLYRLSLLADALNVSMDDLLIDSLAKSQRATYSKEDKELYDELLSFSDRKLDNFIVAIEEFYYFKTGKKIKDLE